MSALEPVDGDAFQPESLNYKVVGRSVSFRARERERRRSTCSLAGDARLDGRD
jgi:hypothetical protein